MFKQFIISFFAVSLISLINLAYSHTFGERYCDQPGYHCITVKKNQSWESLFKDDQERDVVMKLNRKNTYLSRGMRIAVPNDDKMNVLDISPLDRKIPSPGVSTVIVNQDKLAWGAYNADGELLQWGPTSSGRAYCPDIGNRCRTVLGKFTIYHKEGAGCFSTKFPVGKGGAKMPYCMFFKGGYALHGSDEVPGYNASHGCVRIFVSDAEWLNHNFVTVGSTQVVVLPLSEKLEAAPPTAKSYHSKPVHNQNIENSTPLMKGRYYDVYY